MEKFIEFDFNDGGKLRLEVLEDGGLSIRIQAVHPGDGWKVTSSTVNIDKDKKQQIKKWMVENELD
jgi:hypothetical protein